MKRLQVFFSLLAICCIVFSCQKEFSVENGGGLTVTDAQWQFKENGVQFKGPVDTATIDTLGPIAIVYITGHSADGTSEIQLQILAAQLKPGIFKTPFASFYYLKNGVPVYQTDQTATDSFSIVLTKFDSTGIAGTFGGKALLANGTTATKIVDGKFTVILKKSTPVVNPPVSTDSGQVVLWSKASCGGGSNPVSVSVGTKSGQITQFVSTEPATCDPAGSFNLKLPVGTYPVVAKCGTDSVNTTITISKNTCTKLLVDFTKPITGDYYPLTKSSNWSYLYAGGSASDTMYSVNPGYTTTLLGTVHTLQINNYGPGYPNDTAYCRKSGSSYYQYVSPIDFSDTSSGVIRRIKIPAYDFRFLVDNLPAGGTFSDGVTGSVTSSGVTIPITFTFKGTILATGATVTVAGITYTNVIKIRILTTESTGAIRNPEMTEYWYGLNVGAIKYLDYYTDPAFTTPDDVWNLTRYKVY